MGPGTHIILCGLVTVAAEAAAVPYMARAGLVDAGTRLPPPPPPAQAAAAAAGQGAEGGAAAAAAAAMGGGAGGPALSLASGPSLRNMVRGGVDA